MKIAFALLLLASFLFAQNLFAQNQVGAPTPTTASATAAGCGQGDVRFDVKSDSQQHPMVQPEDGKAVLYFVQDDKQFLSRPRPTTRFGIDGEWVGATNANSYFYVSLAPGVHHLCANWQSFVAFGVSENTAAAHFTADAGGVYFFSAQDFWNRAGGSANIKFVPIDSDEGQLLASKFSFSTSKPKKTRPPSE